MKKIICLLSFTLAFSLYNYTFSQNINPKSWHAINQKVLEYYNAGDYENALIYAEKAVKQVEEEYGKNTANYATSLNNLAELYCAMGNYEKSEPLFLEALKIEKEVLGEKHPGYVTGLINIAGLYHDKGNYEKSEPLYLEALKIIKEVLGEKHPDYATSLNNLAGLYYDMGKNEKSEPLYLEALKIRKEVLGEKHPNYATSLSNLAGLYEAMGKYEKSEPLYLEALKIKKEVLGEKHPVYIASLNNLAGLYKAMGNYEKSEPLYLEALKIIKEVLGEKHPNYATSLNNLAGLYKAMGNYEKAEPLYVEALKINKEVLGEKHPDYASSLNNLAGLYESKGNYEKSEPLYLEALKINKEVLGEKHPDYALSLNNLAGLYKSMGNCEKSVPLCLKALKIWKKRLGRKHPSYALILSNLAALYESMGKYEKAESLIIKANQNISDQINTNFSFLSEDEKQQFLKTVSSNFEVFNSFVLHMKQYNPSITATTFDNELSLKGALLQSSSQMRQSVLNSKDTVLISKFNIWLETKKNITTLTMLTNEQRQKRGIDLNTLTEKANVLEKELTVKSNVLKEQVTPINWEDIKKSLKPNEAVVEFINFDYHNKNWTDSNLYIALIIRSDSRYPEIIPLFEEKKLQQYLFGFFSKDTLRGTEIIGTDSSKTSGPLNPEIYNLVWKPIESYLKGANTVYITPSGQLHNLSFAGLKTDSTTFLCDRYNIYTLLSSRDILKLKNEFKESESFNYTASVYGGADYDLAYDKIKKQDAVIFNNKSEGSTKRSMPSNLMRNGTFNYLPGTKTEADNIANLLKGNKCIVSVYSGNTFTEGQFKSQSGTNAPQIIHIATHGFSLPSPVKTKKEGFNFIETNKFIQYDNPLLRTGLIFSGGNQAWSGKEVPEGIDDGILTAYEVSNLNLTNTRLAVLSACETGLGDIKAGEGVFGLQRAFKLAGVGKIIISKWSVRDEETVELMQAFYSEWMSGASIHDAFSKAQHQMRLKYPVEPVKWAAFVLIE